MIYAELSPAERDRLRYAYEAGFALGSGSASHLPDDPHIAALIDAVADNWFRCYETMRAARDLAVDIPWLLAACERVAALGDAPPLEDWPLPDRVLP